MAALDDAAEKLKWVEEYIMFNIISSPTTTIFSNIFSSLIILTKSSTCWKQD